MNKPIYCFFLFIYSLASVSQELKATVIVNADRMTDVNPMIFKNLEKKASEFLNNTKWTGRNFSPNEKINCSFFINVSGYENNSVVATIQVQSARIIYNSTYESALLNINDKDFTFPFQEFEQLIFDQNSFNSNLTSVLGFYAYIILGVDADSFSEFGGTPYYEMANNVKNVSQSSGYKGWTQSEGNLTNRYFLISDILSNTYSPYRKVMYEYHFKGLDVMNNDLKQGKENISAAIQTLAQIQKVRPNAFLTRTFFDAKVDEIVSVFSGGPMMNNAELIETLNKVSPLNSIKWNQIR
jgi:hypothetical protein